MNHEYTEYLNSRAWKIKRSARFKLDNEKCVCCGRPLDLQCHHLTYENYPDEDILNDLVTLCKYCHEDIEKRKHKNHWSVSEQLAYIFIKKYLHKDVLFGGKENLNTYSVIEKYWDEMCKELYVTKRHSYKSRIQNYFARRKEAFIKDQKAKGATAEYLRSRGITENMINKYFYKEDYEI